MTSPELVDQEQSLLALAQMRAKTDVEIPISWLLLPFVNYLVWAILAIGLWAAGGSGGGNSDEIIGGLGVAGLIVSSAAAYVIFSLINRVNEHSARSRALLLSTLESLQSRVRGSDVQAGLSLSSAEEGLFKLSQRERERSAVLWALLSVIPFVGWMFLVIAQWRLSRDLTKHVRFETMVFEDVDRALKSTGDSGFLFGPNRIHSRDLLGIVIVISAAIEIFTGAILTPAGSLTLIYLTIGAISLLWIDLSLRDPRGHFHYHSQVEADLLRALQITPGGHSGAR